MNARNTRTAVTIGALTTLIGSIAMVTGAAIWGASGADIDVAIETDAIAEYLSRVTETRSLLIANLSVWIFGVLCIGAGATVMAGLGAKRPVIATLARYNYWVGIPIVVVSYVAWLAVVVNTPSEPNEAFTQVATALGWFASRADWTATILVLGTGPALICHAGRGEWVPNWLRIWGLLCLIPGFLTGLSMFIGGMPTLGFIIIPVGMLWMFAASAVLFRLRNAHVEA